MTTAQEGPGSHGRDLLAKCRPTSPRSCAVDVATIEAGAPYRRAPIKQSLKRCTLSCPMWLFPSVPSGSSIPTNARHSFSNDDLCAAYEGAANAMRENTSRMVLISNLQGVSALVMSAPEAFMPRISIGECEGRHTGPTAPAGRARAVGGHYFRGGRRSLLGWALHHLRISTARTFSFAGPSRHSRRIRPHAKRNASSFVAHDRVTASLFNRRSK